jgi:2'-5' RNA ligase
VVNTTLRLFIAVEAPEEVIQEARYLQTRFADEHLFEGSFTQPAGLHITLIFLGAVNTHKLDDLKQRLQSVSARQLSARLNGLDLFMNNGNHVIFIRVESPALHDLVAAITQELGTEFRSEEREFVGHITLARIKKINEQAREQLLYEISALHTKPIEFVITSFVLKQSELTPNGSIYTDLAHYQLRT